MPPYHFRAGVGGPWALKRWWSLPGFFIAWWGPNLAAINLGHQKLADPNNKWYNKPDPVTATEAPVFPHANTVAAASPSSSS